MHDDRVKRTFDLCVTVPALILLGPLIIIVAVVVRLKLGSPILFVQGRPGRNGVPFNIIKFRTMIDARDVGGSLLPDEERLPAFGKFLRSTSLDELPELLNVLKGEMSIVGPRPLMMEYLDRYSPAQMRRHNVKPGITGLAQISGRNNLSWEDKFAIDVWYVDHHSFALDLWIVAKTVWLIMTREGVSREGHATTSDFMGTSTES